MLRKFQMIPGTSGGDKIKFLGVNQIQGKT